MNVNGISQVPSWPSTIASLVLYVILMAYGIKKFSQLVNHSNTSISFQTSDGFFPNDEKVSLNKIGFKMAFTVVDYIKN